MTLLVTWTVTSRNVSNSLVEHLIFTYKPETTVVCDSTCRNSWSSKEEGMFLVVGRIRSQLAFAGIYLLSGPTIKDLQRRIFHPLLSASPALWPPK